MAQRIITLVLAAFVAFMSGIVFLVSVASNSADAPGLDGHRVEALNKTADLQLELEWLDAQIYRVLMSETYADDYVAEDIEYQCAVFEEDMSAYETMIVNIDIRKITDEINAVYHNRYKPGILGLMEAVAAGMPVAYLEEEIGAVTQAYTEIADDLESCRRMETDIITMQQNGGYGAYAFASVTASTLALLPGVALTVMAAVGVHIERKRRRQYYAQWQYAPQPQQPYPYPYPNSEYNENKD